MKEWEISDAVSELHRVKMMYGSSDAPFWFVGLEEANGDMEDDPEGLIYGALNMHLDYVRDGKRALLRIPVKMNTHTGLKVNTQNRRIEEWFICTSGVHIQSISAA